MAKKRLSRDQKRRAKLAQRTIKSPAHASLAYTGNKYKGGEYVPVVMATETGIYQAYRITHRKLTDHHVRTALEQLVGQLRAGTLPPFEHACEVEYKVGHEVELVIWGIRHNWEHYLETAPHPGNDALIGILRTLLGSVDNWGTPSPTSRGYLNFLEGFMGKLGVEVHSVDAEGTEEAESEDELLDWGREWCESGHANAREQFVTMANQLIAQGQWERVSNTAQRLLGEYPDGPVPELSSISILAQKAGKQLPGPTG